MEYLYSDITEKVLRAFFNVYNQLGFGFLEKVYENALGYEMQLLGLKVEKQKRIQVHYREIIAGDYFADIIVNDKVIIELKAAEALIEEHEAQLVNYLRATDIEVGLLLNFGKKPQHKRKIFENRLKNQSISVESVRSVFHP
jgi:GxxExxY protein